MYVAQQVAVAAQSEIAAADSLLLLTPILSTRGYSIVVGAAVKNVRLCF